MRAGLSHELTMWLLGAEVRARPLHDVLAELGARLVAGGVPVGRMRTSATTKHPELLVRACSWDTFTGATARDRGRDIVTSAEFLESPVARIRDGSDRIRCRLVGDDAALDFEVCRELADAGFTDYVIDALVFGSGERTYASYATRAPGGFDDDALALFEGLRPAMATRVELESLNCALSGLLRVYLGENAAARVLDGAFVRGLGVPIEAALWFCDMRGFTSLADARRPVEVVRVLDRFFEAVAGPIAPRGGEVLKFIGDAVLAVFPVGAAGPGPACAAALEAARDAIDGVVALAHREGIPELGAGVALHLGEVMYGNIGARDRLDFTVIGAAVNEVCRVEPLCRSLGDILATGAFVQACPGSFESRGEHALKGVAAPVAVYAPR